MFSKIDRDIGFVQSALNVRAMRQEVLASNLANADTPNYKARDVDFAAALRAAKGAIGGNLALTRTDSAHLAASGSGSALGNGVIKYRAAVQPSLDGNTVDSDIEMAQFARNSLDFQASLTFLQGKFRGLRSALKGE